MPRILIGVPTYRRPDMLKRLLRSLEAQQGIEGFDVSVFVADNDPVDSEGVRLCSTMRDDLPWDLAAAVVPQPGISAVRNAILEQAYAHQADFVAMLDDDEWAEPRWLAELLAQQEATGADVVAGPVLYHFESPLPVDLARSGGFPLKSKPSGPIPIVDATGNVLLSMRSLDRVGRPMFDNSFGLTGGGDTEFFARLKKAGLRFAWAESAVTSENVPPSRATRSWVLSRAFRYGNSKVRIARAHRDSARLAKALFEAAVILGTVPLLAPILLMPSRRVWLMRKWWLAGGAIAGLTGHVHHEYLRPS